MTDEELASALAEGAPLGRHTTEGVTAMFAIARRLETERSEFLSPRQVRAARGSHGFTGSFVAQRMLQLVREGRTPAQAVAWFLKASAATRGVGGAVKALYGVQCSKRIELSDDVWLIPYGEIPQSETRDWVLQQHLKANDSSHMHGFTVPPRAALYRPGTLESMWLTDPARDFSKDPPMPWFDDLDTATLLLALTPKAVPIEASHWMNYDDPDLALLGVLGLTRYLPEIQLPFAMGEPTQITTESAAGLFTQYRRVGVSDQGRLKLALQRLIRARSQLNPGNRAIDLAIALEVLFMNHNKDRAEHSYKISLRVAKVVGGELAVKRTAVIETKALYDLRSDMVHSGTAKNDWTIEGVKRNAGDIVDAADRRCALAIRSFLTTGHIPAAAEWRDIELS